MSSVIDLFSCYLTLIFYCSFYSYLVGRDQIQGDHLVVKLYKKSKLIRLYGLRLEPGSLVD
jgi:hypothetical protein